jgi:hypothetical protein
VVLLWAASIPAVSPAVFFDVAISLSPVGNAAMLTFTFTSSGYACGDLKTVDTGGGGVSTRQQLFNLLRSIAR